jgi:hypothetical protein
MLQCQKEPWWRTARICISTSKRNRGPYDLDSIVPIDIRVEIGERILPCRSTLLAVSSEVLRGMIASTEKETWSEGVAAAFEGHPITEVKAFLAIVHTTGPQSKKLETCWGRARYTMIIGSWMV